MLDLMAQKAIEILSSGFGSTPFILMVEGAFIDKQSHPNQAAGTIWDTIEFDKAVGVARAWATKRQNKDTLIVVTADHDQSMHIIGVSNTPDSEYFDRGKNQKISFKTAAGDQDFTVYGDSYANARAGLRRLAVGFRTGDQTGSSVPVTAERDKLLDILTASGRFPKTIGK